MSPKLGQPRLPDEPEFDGGLKCCTFYPNLANFAVGLILDDASCSGREEIKRRIDAGPRVTPLGIGRPPIYGVTYRESARETFGRVPQMRCPFLTSSSECAIIDYREATCVTYYCKFDRGAVGRRFWQALERLLFIIERELALWCVLELDIGADATQVTIDLRDDQKLTLMEVYGTEPAEHREPRWGRWTGRERELFTESARLVAALEWSDVQSICGTGLRVHTRLVRTALERLLSLARPLRVRVGNHRVGQVGAGRSLVFAYSDQDGLEVADEVVAALPRFDGRPTDEVIAELAREGRAVDEEIVQALVDYEILVPTSGPVMPAK